MKVSKWGNSLAIRIPAEQVAALNLREGDEVDAALTLKSDVFATEKRRKLDEAWKAFEKVRHQFKRPANYKFDRDEANSRG